MNDLAATSKSILGRPTAVLCLLLAVGLTAPAGASPRASTVGGTLVETHGHRGDGTMTQGAFAIHAPGRRRDLADGQPTALIGQQVRVEDDGSADIVPGRVRPGGEQRVAPAIPPGPRSLLVVLLTLSDATVPVATPDAARSAVFTAPASANAFFEQQSAGASRMVGRVRADGDVTEPLSITLPTTGCDHNGYANAGDAAARTAGWAPEAYDHVLYALPRNAQCGWGGFGQLPGRRTWTNGNLLPRIVAHELGHNLGAHHANSYRCTDAAGAPVTLSATCTSSEYGDPFDVMGLSAALMSSWHRAQVGQLPAGQQISVRESQTLVLQSSDEFAASGPRLLLVPRKRPGLAVTSWLAIERRSALAPFNIWGPSDPVVSGLSVRVVPALAVAAQTQLLDAQPATAGILDAPLATGQTLRDDAHGIAVEATAVQGTSATVSVTMPKMVDDVAPVPPVLTSIGGNTNSVTLHWRAAIDDDAVTHYDIERDGTIIGTTPGLTFQDTRVSDLTTATYRVIAVDTSGNRGSSVPFTIAVVDATAPSGVPGLTATVSAGTVTLAWSPAQDNRAVASYRVTRDGSVRGDVLGLGFSDSPGPGLHRYELSAADALGNRGPVSRVEAAVTAPESVAAGSAGTGTGLGASTGTSDSGAPANARAGLPRIVLLERRRRGRTVTLRLRATGATSLRAYRGSRLIASAAGPRLTVRVTLPRGAERHTVRVRAASPAGTVSRSWTVS